MEHPLKAWRQRQTPKMTLTALARRVEVTASHLSEIENYKNEPSLDLTDRLSAATGLEMREFVIPAFLKQREATTQ